MSALLFSEIAMRSTPFSLLSLLLATAGSAWFFAAQAAVPDPSATIEKDQRTYLINANGTAAMTRDLAIRINSVPAIAKFANQAFDYNATLETLDIVDAYTEKPDGRRVPVPPDRIREQQAQGSRDTTLFADERIKVAIFPQVEVGDRLVMQIRQNQIAALIPGQFQDIVMPPEQAAPQQRLIYDLPADMALYADARGYVARPVDAAPGRKRYQYEYAEHDRAEHERGAVSPLDVADRLVVSTMADYAALAAAYERGAQGKAAVSPAIRALGESITRGADGQRAKALLLADWVRKNIRYVAVYIGDGGVVPHAANEVLEQRYGDCKDHATLLEALLASAGIPSTPALISSGSAFTLPSVAAVGVLNHVITYVPSLDLFVDATAGNVAAGYLPQADLDKQVVLTKTGALARTPARQKTRVLVESKFVIDAHGDYKIARTTTAQGAAAEHYRRRDPDAGPHRSEETTVVEPGMIDGGGDEYVYGETIRGKSPSPDKKHIELWAEQAAGSAISWLVTTRDMVAEKSRIYPYPCAAEEIEQRTHIRVPASFRLAKLPPPVALRTAQFDYNAEYRREGQAILIHQHYHAHPARAFCTPDEAKARQALLGEMMMDTVQLMRFAKQ